VQVPGPWAKDTAQTTAEQDWDSSKIIGGGGQWTVMAG
jgi:hypothetical protein